ncbi:hypothetical protein ACA545_02130, partial [Vibrio cholerae]|uniref:hypothetical protein n=1 Tax=Vibrio cholerae TaxID=666 RepID=UPI003A1021C7
VFRCRISAVFLGVVFTRNAEITVTDAAGNSTTKSDSEDYIVDTVAPELGIDLDPIVGGA